MPQVLGSNPRAWGLQTRTLICRPASWGLQNRAPGYADQHASSLQTRFPRFEPIGNGVVMPCHREFQRLQGSGVVPQATDTWRWGCHALGARARPVRLGVDPGKRVCRTARQICRPASWGLQNCAPSLQTSTLGADQYAQGLQTPSPGSDPLVMYQRPNPRLMDPASGSNSLGSGVRTKVNGSSIDTQFSWVQRLDPILLGSLSGPNSIRFDVRTQGQWVLRQDPFSLDPTLGPRVMSPTSGLKVNRSCVDTQFSWVWYQNPRFQSLRFLNIIICIINIVIFIIIKHINIKKILLFVL